MILGKNMETKLNNNLFIGEMKSGDSKEKEMLDLKDRKILYELSRNARFSYTTIGRLVGLSREVVEYRIKRLIQNGIIPGFMTLVDITKIGYLRSLVFIKFQNLDDSKEKMLIDWLVKNNDIIWVATCTGNWDMGLIIKSKDLEGLYDVFNRLKTFAGVNIIDYIILNEISNIQSSLKFFIDGLDYTSKKIERDSGSFQRYFYLKDSKVPHLKDKEKKVLSVLVNDARANIKEVAKRVGCDVNTVTSIIKKLIMSGIIYGFVPQVSLFKLGYQWHWIFLRFYNLNEKNENKILRYFQIHPYIVWCVKHVGNWDMQISVFAHNSNHFRDIYNEIKREFSDILVLHDSVMIFDQYKYSLSLD